MLASFGVMSHLRASFKSIDIEGQYNLGNIESPVQVVVFLDFRCSACDYFESQIFPLLQRRYIHTDKISYTMIPIAFLKGSARLLEGFYCTRGQKPRSFC